MYMCIFPYSINIKFKSNTKQNMSNAANRLAPLIWRRVSTLADGDNQ